MNCMTESTDTTYGYLSEFTGNCEDIDLYATSADYPEHHPIYYIRVKIHYILTEDPLNPRNFTETDDGNLPNPECA